MGEESHPGHLFRPQACSKNKNLEGSIILHAGKTVGIATAVLFASLLIALSLLCRVDVPRIQQVSGWITTDRGLVQIQALRPGIVQTLPIHLGSFVHAGEVLATIRIEQNKLSDGETPETALLRALDEQSQKLQQEVALVSIQAGKDTAHSSQSLSALRSELLALKTEILHQNNIVTLAEQTTKAEEKLFSQGALSRLQLVNAESDLAQKRQGVAALEQQLASIRSTIATASGDLSRVPLDRDRKIAEVQATAATLHQRIAEIQGQRGYAVIAPIDGRVANLIARIGYPADGRQPLMTIVPSRAKLVAELFVPTSAIGFLQQNQKIRILYDAFPYQKYGAHSGTITGISSSASLPTELAAPVDIKEPIYTVTASLEEPLVRAYGHKFPLQPGMTLSGDVILESRTIFRWLFDPIFALKRAS